MKSLKEGRLPKAFENASWYQRSIKWYKAAQEKFEETFLAKKYFINYIIDQGREAADPTAFYDQMEDRINRLTAEQIQLITHPSKGSMTQEQSIIDTLIQCLGQ